MKKIFQTHIKKTSGFTLLFAMLVASLVVAIGATIISIALRQTILSGTSRESQYAFYAANTALECAYYWDTTTSIGEGEVVFPAPGTNDMDVRDTGSITCSDSNIFLGPDDVQGTEDDLFSEDPDLDESRVIFKIKITDVKGIQDILDYEYCATVILTKENSGGKIKTTIDARGYNTCDETSPRRVERGLVQEYES